MNPMAFMKMQPMLEQFQERHPKFFQFFAYAGHNLDVDSLLEISITSADGKKTVTNIRITEEDMELMEKMKELIGS